MTNILTIAAQTFTEARRNRVFYSLFLFALVVVLSSVLSTEVTIATVDRMLKDTGLAAINIFVLALTIFTGVGIINREIDRKSIYSILAKPVSRLDFIVGKYLGLLAIGLVTSGVMFLGLLVTLIGYKTPIHAGVFLGYLGVVLEAMVLGSFAVLCSSFTTSFISAFICGAVFISGHISTEFYRAVEHSDSSVRRLVGAAVYYVVPNLERFNFKYQATYDLTVPGPALLMVVAFALAYVAAALLGAVVVFSRRDFR